LDGSSEIHTKGYMETYKNVSQDIQNQLDAEAEAVYIILTGIDNDIYSTVDVCPNACEMWKANERLKQDHNKLLPETEKNEIDKLMALISLLFNKIYKSTNNNLRTLVNTSRANQDNTPRINKGTGYDNQRAVNVARDRENVGTHVIQEVTPDAANNSGPIFHAKPLQNIQTDNDNYNVFANDKEHLEQPETVNDIFRMNKLKLMLFKDLKKMHQEINTAGSSITAAG
nr:hypothetical protein [Tanacetum cinerariifolium]